MGPEVEDHLHGRASLHGLNEPEAACHRHCGHEGARAQDGHDEDRVVERQDDIGLADGQLHARQLGGRGEEEYPPPWDRQDTAGGYRGGVVQRPEDDSQPAGEDEKRRTARAGRVDRRRVRMRRGGRGRGFSWRGHFATLWDEPARRRTYRRSVGVALRGRSTDPGSLLRGTRREHSTQSGRTGPGAFVDPSSADPGRRRPCGLGRHNLRVGTEFGTRPCGAANGPCRAPLNGFDEERHLFITRTTPRDGTITPRARPIASPRCQSGHHEARPSPRSRKALARC